ncbi:MAG: SMP-30/gluconolactonase/LRE family protein [Spirochaetales bacterium]|nr:SMP-30/gluconolactonase/LRE family protein [Spirochaetales bacterium]
MSGDFQKTKIQYFCGEAPVVHPATGFLYFIDTGNPTCTELDPASGKTVEHELEGNFQCLGFRESGGWIAVLDDRLVTCDENFKIIEDLGNPLKGRKDMLLGDGTAGPDGCFYFGAYNCADLYSKDGCVFRVNKDLTIEEAVGGLALPNGLAFNQDGSRFYVTEMFASCIWSYNFDKETGEISGKKLFAEIPEENGLPDGLIIDAEDFLWSAHWAGYRLTRYNQEGTVERVVKLPVPTPTCMAFGGEKLETLYITTARKGLSEEELAAYPDSGDLFILDSEIKGRLELFFKG